MVIVSSCLYTEFDVQGLLLVFAVLAISFCYLIIVVFHSGLVQFLSLLSVS